MSAAGPNAARAVGEFAVFFGQVHGSGTQRSGLREQGVGLFQSGAHPAAGEDLPGLLQRLGGLAGTGEPAYVERTRDPDLARMASVLARTETLGVSLRDATRELAATVREARRTSTLERARTAPVRMLFPLVLFR